MYTKQIITVCLNISWIVVLIKYIGLVKDPQNDKSENHLFNIAKANRFHVSATDTREKSKLLHRAYMCLQVWADIVCFHYFCQLKKEGATSFLFHKLALSQQLGHWDAVLRIRGLIFNIVVSKGWYRYLLLGSKPIGFRLFLIIAFTRAYVLLKAESVQTCASNGSNGYSLHS